MNEKKSHSFSSNILPIAALCASIANLKLSASHLVDGRHLLLAADALRLETNCVGAGNLIAMKLDSTCSTDALGS